jgi:hypothetical protein
MGWSPFVIRWIFYTHFSTSMPFPMAENDHPVFKTLVKPHVRFTRAARMSV